MPSVQVENAHYGGAYDHKARWLNYWYQIRETQNANPKTVLEIGLGNGLVASYLRKQGIEVTTLDIDASLKPDVVGSITKIPLPDNAFDTVLAAEVIEHIPFEEVGTALREMARVSKGSVVVSTPDSRRTLLSFDFKLPLLPRLEIFWKISSWKKHVWNGQHYWEMGKPGFSFKRIAETAHASGLRIARHYVPRDCPTKHVFVFKKA